MYLNISFNRPIMDFHVFIYSHSYIKFVSFSTPHTFYILYVGLFQSRCSLHLQFYGFSIYFYGYLVRAHLHNLLAATVLHLNDFYLAECCT